jgi:NTP pyrophosphatase (non-canonical NTP hydrolase)
MEISEFQKYIGDIYLQKDSARGMAGTFAWLVEEVGELWRAIRKGEPDSLNEEFADVLAWLASLANLCGVDMEAAIEKYGKGCPKCGNQPCSCQENPPDR